MKKIFSALSWVCLAAAFFCLIGIFKNQQQAKQLFWDVRLIWCKADSFLLLAAGSLVLLSGICRAASDKKKSVLFWLPLAALLCCFSWQGVSILRGHETGTLAEAIDRHVSPEATIKNAYIVNTSFDTGASAYTELLSPEIEQLEAVLATCAYSNCAPNEIFQREKCSIS